MKTRLIQVLATLHVVIVVLIASCAASSMAQEITGTKDNHIVFRGESQRAYEGLLQRATDGIPQAQFNLALMLASGIGVKVDLEQAALWYQRAAESGHTIAQYHLGHAYLNGVGIQKDPRKAVLWWRKAAQGGYATAQLSLGRMLMYGIGVDVDHVEGLTWVRRGAAQGDPHSIVFLAQLQPVLGTYTDAAPAVSQASPRAPASDQAHRANLPAPLDTAPLKHALLAQPTMPSVETPPLVADLPQGEGSMPERSEVQATRSDDTLPSVASQRDAEKEETTITASSDSQQWLATLSEEIARVVAPTTLHVQRTLHDKNDNAWLYAQHPEHYSVQLVSTTSETDAEQYIERNHLGSRARYFHARLRGKDWYYVLYGSFVTLDEAEAVRQRIQTSARIRRFGVLQKRRCAGAAELPPQQSLEVALFCALLG